MSALFNLTASMEDRKHIAPLKNERGNMKQINYMGTILYISVENTPFKK